MKPNEKTLFKSIDEIINYSDPEKYFCEVVVFSPETENNHFQGCPPYIKIASKISKVLNIIENMGARELANKIKDLLDIE